MPTNMRKRERRIAKPCAGSSTGSSTLFVPRQRYDLLREWVLHYVEDEAADRVMPEADVITLLKDLGFADVRIAYRRYMDAVLIAHKP